MTQKSPTRRPPDTLEYVRSLIAEMLRLLGRRHPMISYFLGMAHAETLDQEARLSKQSEQDANLQNQTGRSSG